MQTRREFLRAAAAFGAGLVAVACQPMAVGPTAVPEAGEKAPAVKAPKVEVTEVTIQTAWFAQEEPGRDFWQRVIKAFSACFRHRTNVCLIAL